MSADYFHKGRWLAKGIFNKPDSHRFPENPFKHRHSKLTTPLIQVPPLRHESFSQWLISVKKIQIKSNKKKWKNYSRSYQVYTSIRSPEGCHVALESTFPAQLKPKGVDFILGIGSFGFVYFHDSVQRIRTAFGLKFWTQSIGLALK